MTRSAIVAWLATIVAALPWGVAQSQDDPDVFRARRMPYAAFDRLPATSVMIGKSELTVGFAPGTLDLPQAVVVDWIASSARIMAAYYGGIPVDRVRILVVPAAGDRVLSGTTFAHRGAAIRLVLGEGATSARLADDWILVHELVHLAFPSMPETRRWIEEGLASYVEPIARAQSGKLRTGEVWREYLKGMPKGLPETGDRGLDHTPTWGRTYWGGALFCLLADVDIRERTDNRFGLQDALRAIVAAGGNVEASWPIERAMRIGDEAVGVPVLMELYERMKATPVAVDLPQLWRRLGVALIDDAVVFDETAPLAPIRRAITMRRDSRKPEAM